MYEVSKEYMELLNDETSVIETRLRCKFGGAITLGGETIQRFELTERVNSNSNILTFGNACSNSIIITLINPPEIRYKGLLCEPEHGIVLPDGSVEWIPLG